jgi:predicted  nucleic acid-binding Zn-ribbon protein
MFKFLKDMIRPGKEEGSLSLGSAEIPPFLDAGLSEGSATLYEKTKVHRRAVEAERQELQELLDEISSKEREESYHPKIEKVAKNTLPLFRKAMLSALAKDLPPDPEEFYTAAGECLKGCVKGLAGPGRYLQGVFPEEIKKIREAVDRVGREVNAMTPAVAEARKRRDIINRIRTDLSRYSSASSDRRVAGAEIERLRQEITVANEELQRIREQTAALESGPEAREAEELAGQLELLKGVLAGDERSLRADLAVIAHVLRKGEKVVQRSQGGAAAKGLEETVDLLAGSGIPDEEQLLPALGKTLPLIESMLQSGDITLKNKEEKELFAPEHDLMVRVQEDYRRLTDARSALRDADHAYRQSRYQRRLKEYEEGIMQAESHIVSLTSRITALDERITVLEKDLPSIRQSLETLLGDLAGRPVIFVVPKED